MSPLQSVRGAESGVWKSTPVLEPSVPPKNTTPYVPWTRPADWLPTTVVAGEQKIQCLVAVSADFATTPCTIRSSGVAITIDWGDGTAPENVATNTTVAHFYTFASVGSTTTEGFRQALITITPQTGNLLSLSVIENIPGGGYCASPVLEMIFGPSTITALTVGGGVVGFPKATKLRNVEFLSPVALTVPSSTFNYCTALRRVAGQISSTSSSAASMFANCVNLESVPDLRFPSAQTFTSMFTECYRLTTAPPMPSSNVTDFSLMFYNCPSLVTAPYLDTSKGTNFSTMFQNCFHLVSVPPLDTSKATNTSYMFSNCVDLEYIPPLNTPLVTNTSAMFNLCTSLISVPALNTASSTNFSLMFASCYRLESIPVMDTSKVTNFTSAFSTCHRLTSLPTLNVTAGATTTSMFNGCYRLPSITLTGPNAIGNSMTNMFSDCRSLSKTPAVDFSGATSGTGIFSACYSLVEIGGTVNLNAVTSAATLAATFSGCYNLRRLTLPAGGGPRFSFTIGDTMLDAAAVDAIYTVLPTITAQTVTVTNVPGALTDTPTIATAKGWTVTG